MIEQKHLYGDETSPGLLVHSSRFGLLYSLAAQAILPATCLPESGDPVTEACGDNLLVIGPGLPDRIADAVASAGKENFSILLRLQSGIKTESMHWIEDGAPGFRWACVPGPLPFGLVRSAVVRTQEEMRDIQVRSFGDLDIDSVRFEVIPDLFGGREIELGRFLESLASEATTEPPLDPDRVRLSDKACGALATLAKAMPSNDRWFRSLASALGAKGVKGARSRLRFERLPGLSIAESRPIDTPDLNLDETALTVAFRVLSSTDPRKGWIPSSILETISESLLEEPVVRSDNRAREQIKRWAEASADLLDDRGEIHPLSDDRNLVLRAILLMLLRETPESILQSAESYFRPGPRVRAIAAMLAGFHRGFKGLSAEFKRPEPLGRYLGAVWCSSVRPESESPALPELVFSEERFGGLSKRLCLRTKDDDLLHVVVEAHPALRTVRALGEGLGFDLCPTSDDETLRYTWEWPNGRRQPVYLRLLTSTWREKPLVRFYSPCLSVETVARNSASEAEIATVLKRTRSKSVDRPSLIEMLLQQGRDDVHCRFVVDSRDGVIAVAVDQLVETLDAAEFRAHLEHVARVADDFEQARGRDDFR